MKRIVLFQLILTTLIFGLAISVSAQKAPSVVAVSSSAPKLTKIVAANNRQGHMVRYFTYGTMKNRVVLTRSDADILTDGDISKVPASLRINDKYRQSVLAVRIIIDGVGKPLKLNPYKVNYTVIPKERKFISALFDQGVKLKSIYYVLDIYTGKSGFGIVADRGPGGQTTNGEFSVHQIYELGYDVDRKTGTGGTNSNDLITIIFPNSDKLISDEEYNNYVNNNMQTKLQERINLEGRKLLKAYSSQLKTTNLESAVDELKRISTHVDFYD